MLPENYGHSYTVYDLGKILQNFLKIQITTFKFQDFGWSRGFDGAESISTIKIKIQALQLSFFCKKKVELQQFLLPI